MFRLCTESYIGICISWGNRKNNYYNNNIGVLQLLIQGIYIYIFLFKKMLIIEI